MSGAASPPAFLDRLDGQAALAADDPARATEALSRASAELGSRQELTTARQLLDQIP